METLTTVRSADFAAPWRDLRDRLISGYTNLSGMLRDASAREADDQTRLAWKRDALDAALDTWDRLNDKIADQTIDHVTAWRTFTDQVEYLFHVTTVHPGYYQGVQLALTYQRGYGQHIDAPVIINPHAGK